MSYVELGQFDFAADDWMARNPLTVPIVETANPRDVPGESAKGA